MFIYIIVLPSKNDKKTAVINDDVFFNIELSIPYFFLYIIFDSNTVNLNFCFFVFYNVS